MRPCGVACVGMETKATILLTLETYKKAPVASPTMRVCYNRTFKAKSGVWKLHLF